MAAWEELRIALARLVEQRPGAVILHPNLDGDVGPPPYPIGLAPWAESLARELHERFGDLVELTVGALPYPPGSTPWWQSPRPAEGSGGKPPGEPAGAAGATGEPAALLDPAEVTAELDGPAVVSSGHTLRHGLLLRNHTGAALAIATNGQVTAVVVDPHTARRFEDPRFGQHVAFLNRMREDGYLVLAGPLGDAAGEGMTILRLPGAGRLAEATRLATEDDASVAGGFFTVTVRPWEVMMGAG